jgi:hypothetical protein
MNGALDVHDAIHTTDYRLGLMRLHNDGSMLMRLGPWNALLNKIHPAKHWHDRPAE